MSEHTKEPWRVGNLESFNAYTGKPFRNIWADDPDGKPLYIGQCLEHGDVDANARRIVACVNYCRLMHTFTMEEIVRRGEPLPDKG